MKKTNYLIYFILMLALLLVHGYALADGPDPNVSKTLAVVPVKSGEVDQSVYRQFDRLVPELKKISRNKIVKLECRYSGQPDLEQDVENAYNLAARVEKYLRVRHKLDLDLWVAIDIIPKSIKSSPVLTIAVFSDDIKKLETERINPLKNEL
jgi:hypothetical protein